MNGNINTNLSLIAVTCGGFSLWAVNDKLHTLKNAAAKTIKKLPLSLIERG